MDKAFLRQHFADDRGNLYKPDCGPLVYRGGAISDDATTVSGGPGGAGEQLSGEEAYAKKTNEQAGDLLHDPRSCGPWPRQLLGPDRPDGDPGRRARGGHRDRFAFVPWDLNNSFGTFDCFALQPEQVLHLAPREPYCLGTPDAAGEGRPIEVASRPLISRVLAVPALRQAYEARLRELLAGPLAPEAMVAEIRRAHELIAPSLAQDPRPFYTAGESARSLTERVDRAPGLEPFVRERAALLLEMLDTPVACGDGECGPGENCAADCNSRCPVCQVWHAPMSRCVPSCAGDCRCPPTSPDGRPLVCDPQGEICHP